MDSSNRRKKAKRFSFLVIFRLHFTPEAPAILKVPRLCFHLHGSFRAACRSI